MKRFVTLGLFGCLVGVAGCDFGTGLEDGAETDPLGAVAAVAAALAADCPTGEPQATFTVTTVADAGEGSLRQAILDANASPGLDRIVFAIPAEAGLTVTLLTDLPAITEAVVIDGTTQAGIVLQPAVIRTGTCLTLASCGSTVQGIKITNFATGIRIADVPGNTVRGMTLASNRDYGVVIAGPNAAGNVVAANTITASTRGVSLEDAGANTIGGPGADDGNVLGNGGIGIWIEGGGGNVLKGNFVGVRREQGTVTWGTGGDPYANYYLPLRNEVGIRIESSSGNLVEGNQVCANRVDGIRIVTCEGANYLYGNNIGGWVGSVAGGSDRYRTASLETAEGPVKAGNGYVSDLASGVVLQGSSNQVIGGPGRGNFIAHNSRGISVQDDIQGTRQSRGNVIQGNDLIQTAPGNYAADVSLIGAADTLVGGWEAGEPNFFLGLGAMAEVLVISVPGDYVWGSLYPASRNRIVGNMMVPLRQPSTPRSTPILLGGAVEATSILGNSFNNSNDTPPIDLGAVLPQDISEYPWVIPLHGDGPTPNDPLDEDAGPNGLQNHPEITLAWRTASTVGLTATLDSKPLTSYHVEFQVRKSGWSLTTRYFDSSTEVRTDASGHATFTASLPRDVADVYATATDSDGNTSEMSPKVPVSTNAPVASAGPDQAVTVPHDGDPATGTVAVTLDGSASSDPDGDAMTFLWREGATVLGTGPVVTADLLPGTHVITLEVTDSWGAPATATTTVLVSPEANQAPVASAKAEVLATDPDATATVALDGIGSSDPDGDPLAWTWTEDGAVLATGATASVTMSACTHTLVLTVVDSYGATATDTVVVAFSGTFLDANNVCCMQASVGCDGFCNSGLVTDDCQVCGGGNRDQGCDGVCFSGKENDRCGVCGGDGIDATPTTCGTGACASTGVRSCVGPGVFQDTCTPGIPTPEACNGLDDDCNDAVDDGIVPVPTTCGVGGCAGTGTLWCIEGTPYDSCLPGDAAADDATCDGVDDDCDGQTDEDWVATSCGIGACASADSCFAGVVQACVPATPTAEVRDGLDNDCDGFADEGTACTADGECATGFCIDGVCCTTSCGDGLATDCMACSVAAGAAVDGTCGPVAKDTVCRAATGACDVAETCNGTSAACPADRIAAAGTVCRASAGPCDLPETCSGRTKACPKNAFLASGTVCRPSAGPCDVADTCTGKSPACIDRFLAKCRRSQTCQSGVCER